MKKRSKTFIGSYLLLGFIAGIAGALVLLLFGLHKTFPSLMSGWLISLMIILFGYVANHWAFSRSHKVFLAVLLGGMVLRIALVIGIVFWINSTQLLPMLPFLVTLTIYYFIFQSIEIVVIKRQLNNSS